MITAAEHYQSGKLADAVSAATQTVKTKPGDLTARHLLSELLCFTGDLDRADKQLDALMQQEPKLGVGAMQFRHLIRAEQARRQFYSEGRLPEFQMLPSDEIKLRLQASCHVRDSAPATAMNLLTEADSRRPKLSGECDGVRFEDFRDLDDVLASALEVVTTNGKYYWLPFENVQSMEFRKPERPRDLYWRSLHVVTRDGIEGEVYVPVLYVDSYLQGDDLTRLGRYTDWQGGEGAPVRGVGLKTFLVGEETKTILEITKVTFDTAA